MSDVFRKEDMQRIFSGKSILFLGDSIMRNIYKDFVYLTSPDISGNKFVLKNSLIRKGETSFVNDKLLSASDLHAGRNYSEKRDWYDQTHDIQYSFSFITRCFSDDVKRFFKDYKSDYGTFPDLIIINSALWDVNRWGPESIRLFKWNIFDLMKLFQNLLPSYTQVIWMTTPPISVEIRSGFLIEQLRFQEHSMRFNIMEANHYAATVVASFGFDVLDMHYHFCHQIHRRSSDGIHWQPVAVRMQVNIITTFFCKSREKPLPKNWSITSFTNGQILHNVGLENSSKFVKSAIDDVLNEKIDLVENEKKRWDERSRKYEEIIQREGERKRKYEEEIEKIEKESGKTKLQNGNYEWGFPKRLKLDMEQNNSNGFRSSR